MKPKETDYFIAWLIFTLCSSIGGFILGAVAGFFIGIFLGILKVDMAVLQIVCGLAGFLVSLPLNYLFFRIFVGHFIVKKLVEEMPAAPGDQYPMATPSSQ